MLQNQLHFTQCELYTRVLYRHALMVLLMNNDLISLFLDNLTLT